jgi:hypothetical protein
MNTNTNVTDTKPLTRKQKRWRRYRQYLKQKKLEKQLEDYFDDLYEDLFYDDNGLSRYVDKSMLKEIAKPINKNYMMN